MANTIKMNRVIPDVIKLQLFPFSLRNITADWFESLSYGSVTTWEELVEAYLRIFFSSTLTPERIGEIIAFKQKKNMSLFIMLRKGTSSY